MFVRRKLAKLSSLGSAKKQWMTCINHLRNGFQGETLPGTQSSHHFIPLLSSKIADKLLSEDESHVGTHDFNLPTTF